MKLDSIFDLPFVAYSSARGAIFSAEFVFLNALSAVFPQSGRFTPKYDLKTTLKIRKAILDLYLEDARNIRKGIYPAKVLQPESPFAHFLRLPRLMYDGATLYLRRLRGRTTEFTPEAKEFLSELPRYYRRNFHFQTDGYLSSRSAELYEHQVEILFAGGADAMRRLIIPPMREAFKDNKDGKGLTFLEIGAGTGRATKFVRLAFPKARIVVTDLSDPYLKEAQKKLSRYSRLDFVQADGTKLPFQDGMFDAVYSVFLYHELPMDQRKEVIAESLRVLKPNGFIGLVDSMQKGERKEFDSLLENFPQNYHEPFYRNYIEHPMEELFQSAGVQNVRLGQGYFSKLCCGSKQ
jgi:ubiquinone/menaquinone biosynthesis C-methylase UbiE